MHSFKISPYLVDNEYFRFICGENGRPLTSREAFLYFYGGRVLFYKTGTANGTAYGKYEYIGAPVNRSGIKVYTAANITSPNTGYRWATHEMGHYFEARVNDIRGWGHVRNQLEEYSTLDENDPAYIPRRGTDNNERSYGFADVRYGWQQSPEATAAEEFADMFLGWNYNRWAPSTDRDYLVGQARANFMDSHMASWIALVINRERRKTR